MSDLISRQAAIDAIKKCRSESDMPDMWYDGMSCALRCLYKLPSAQPKSYREGYQAGVKDAQPEQRWIPCSERLPESSLDDLEYPTVIICCDDGTVTLACYYESTKEWGCGENFDSKCFPSAWLPLPKPYKENDHD